MVSKKKNWCKIDVSAVEAQLVAEGEKNEVSQRDDLILLDSEGGSRKGQKQDSGLSFYQNKAIKKALRKLPVSRNAALEEKARKRQREDVFDLWEDEELTETSAKRPKKPADAWRVSLVPSVKLPHPGQSVNPLESERVDLLEEEAAKELEKVRCEKQREEELLPLTAKLSEYVSPDQLAKLTLVERQLLWKDKDVGADAKCFDEVVVAPQKLPPADKKTPWERTKQKRQKAHLQRVESRVAAKEFNRTMNRFRSIVKDVKAAELMSERRAAYRRSVKESRRLEASKGVNVKSSFGSIEFAEKPQSVLLSDDLKRSDGSLRRLPIPQDVSAVMEGVMGKARRGLMPCPSSAEDKMTMMTKREKARRKHAVYVDPQRRRMVRAAAEVVAGWKNRQGKISSA